MEESCLMEDILNRTLDIISILYGETFTVVKIGGRVSIMVPLPECPVHEKTEEEKILNVMNKITELLTGVRGRPSDGNVVVKTEKKEEDMAGGVLENADKDKAAMIEDQPTDGSKKRRCLHPLYSQNSTLDNREIPQHDQDLMDMEVEDKETEGQQSVEKIGRAVTIKEEEETSVRSDQQSLEKDGTMVTMKYAEETSAGPEQWSAGEIGMIVKVKVGECSTNIDTSYEHDRMIPLEDRLTLYPKHTTEGDDNATQVSARENSAAGNTHPEFSISDRPPDPSPPEQPSLDMSYILTQSATGGAEQTILYQCPVYKQIIPLKPVFVIQQTAPTGENDGAVQSSSEKRSGPQTGEKMFKCWDCEKLFKDKKKLITHQDIHIIDRPFQCPECGTRFKKKSGVTEHIMIHTGEKPFACTECDYRSIRRSKLILHLKTHTKVDPPKRWKIS